MAELSPRKQIVPADGQAYEQLSIQPRAKAAEVREIEGSIVELLPRLRAFARSLTRDRTAADDLLQETFVRALGHIHQFRPGTNLKAWIFAIMRNTRVSQGKRQSRELRIFKPDEGDIGSGGAMQGWSRASGVMAAALSQLPPDQKETVVLISCLGLSYEECAEACGCPIGTVKSRLNRGRETLRRILDAEVAEDLV